MVEEERGEGRLGTHLRARMFRGPMKEGVHVYQDRSFTPRAAQNTWSLWPKKKSAFSLQGLSPVLCL